MSHDVFNIDSKHFLHLSISFSDFIYEFIIFIHDERFHSQFLLSVTKYKLISINIIHSKIFMYKSFLLDMYDKFCTQDSLPNNFMEFNTKNNYIRRINK